ncbi:helix-turn-helix domain-containing protein [Novosphingobium resinovorum]|uniref:helix-turn-helix domain-containing protein n=1 Tax=Novosphingobium resinovorum TaxID=158500 RepID=UPI0039B75DF5
MRRPATRVVVLRWPCGKPIRSRSPFGQRPWARVIWVLRFNEGGPDGLATRKAPGRAAILNDEQRARLAAIVEAGPIPAAHGVVRWRLPFSNTGIISDAWEKGGPSHNQKSRPKGIPGRFRTVENRSMELSKWGRVPRCPVS